MSSSPPPHPGSVFVIDDEPDLRELVAFNLESAGFEVYAYDDGTSGILAARELRPAIVILDLMLPDLSGLDVCRHLRDDPSTTDSVIIMLTARSNEADRLLGFEVGADDYVVKPFSVREVVLRVRAFVRRAQERAKALSKPDEGRRLEWQGLMIDPRCHRVSTDGVELPLRPLEYKLLSLLMEHPGTVFSRKDLLAEVWGISPSTNTRTVDVHMRRLRVRLGDYGKALETVHGVGYRLSDQAT